MIALKTILVPTDFSPPSEIAVNYAKEFAKAFRAKLHVLHVTEDALAYASVAAEGGLALSNNFAEDLQISARRHLHELFTDDEQQRFDPEFVAVSGHPFEQITLYAQEHDIDLIVMGTHGRGPIAHLLMGSVAERVVRKAPCPVLTVRHPEHEFVIP